MKSRLYGKLFLVFSIIMTACHAPTPIDSNEKIFNGSKVAANSTIGRSAVALVSEHYEAFCSGILIASDLVLTAAHCLLGESQSSFTVAFHVKPDTTNLLESNIRDAADFVIHQSYDENMMNADEPASPPADIALIKLASAAPENYTPIAIASANSELKKGQSVTLAGFGITSLDQTTGGELYKIELPLGQIDSAAKELVFIAENGRSACMGDSGGPALITNKNGLQVIGVTSRGTSLCNGEMRYTDVRGHEAWLKATLSKWQTTNPL